MVPFIRYIKNIEIDIDIVPVNLGSSLSASPFDLLQRYRRGAPRMQSIKVSSADDSDAYRHE